VATGPFLVVRSKCVSPRPVSLMTPSHPCGFLRELTTSSAATPCPTPETGHPVRRLASSPSQREPLVSSITARFLRRGTTLDFGSVEPPRSSAGPLEISSNFAELEESLAEGCLPIRRGTRRRRRGRKKSRAQIERETTVSTSNPDQVGKLPGKDVSHGLCPGRWSP
jgi:hypothetical protein